MKHRWIKTLALLLALLLAVVTIAFAEGTPAAGDGEANEGAENGTGIESANTDPVVDEVEELVLGDITELPGGEDSAAGDGAGDADWNGVQTWWFIVGDEAALVLEVREGDEIQRPDDPAAPEGMAFAGWTLEDGAPLFVDEDGDGEIDPVVAHPDPLTTEVNVLAAFVEEEEDSLRHGDAVTPPSEREAMEGPSESEEGSLPEGAGSPQGETEGVPQEGEISDEDSLRHGDAVTPPSEREAMEEPSESEEGSLPEGAGSPQGETEGVPQGAAPTPNALTYTGEAQALVSAQPGAYLYSLDGENYNEEIPSAVNAGEYTVYFVPADDAEAEPQALTVTVAKADVVFTPPEAATGEE